MFNPYRQNTQIYLEAVWLSCEKQSGRGRLPLFSIIELARIAKALLQPLASNGHSEGEGRAVVGDAVHPDAPAVRFDGQFAER